MNNEMRDAYMKANMPHPNIHKYLDLSTGHITKETCNNPPYKVADYEYGAMLYVPDEVHSQCPEDLAKVIEYAKKHDCAMILFDRDAGTCEDLPIYDWSPPEQSEADKLRNIKESLLLAIAHRFLREYDSEIHDGTMKELVAELDAVERQIEELKS